MGSITPDLSASHPRWRYDTRYKRYLRDDERGNLIAPLSAQPHRIGAQDEAFVFRCAQDVLCSFCGRRFAWIEARYYLQHVNPDGSVVSNEEPPMHRACAAYTVRACPRLRVHKTPIVVSMTGKIFGVDFTPGPHHRIIAFDDFVRATRPKRMENHERHSDGRPACPHLANRQ